MISSLKSTLSRNITNALGKRTNSKIVVIESDDWGMIRTSSQESYNRLAAKGYPVDKCVYNRNDSLESNEDVLNLMEVLSKHRGDDGKYAKFTLNNVVANPDFQRIKASNFYGYYYQPFTCTLDEYKNSEEVFNLYEKGITDGVFQP